MEKGGHDYSVVGTVRHHRRKYDERPVKIRDIRGREEEFDLRTQGFQFVESPTVGGDFKDSERVKREVYPETVKLLKEVYVFTQGLGISAAVVHNSQSAIHTSYLRLG